MDISKEVLEKYSSDIQQMRNEIDVLLKASEADSKDFKAEIEEVSNKLSDVAKELSLVSDKYRDKLENRNSLLQGFNDKLVHHSKLLAEIATSTREQAAGEVDGQQLPRCFPMPTQRLPVQVRSPDTSSCLTHSTVDSPTMRTKHQAEEFRLFTDVDARRVRYHYELTSEAAHDQAESSCQPFVYVPSATSTPQAALQEIKVQTEIIKVYGYKGKKQQFRYPYQVANGCNNELIVTDRENHQLLVLDENLNFLFVYGKHGAGSGKLYNPTGLAVDVDGRFLYVSDHNNLIQKFAIERLEGMGDVSNEGPQSPFNYVDCYGGKGSELGQLLFPCGLAWSKNDLELFVCDYGNHRIQVFTRTDVRSFGQHGTSPGEFCEPHSIVLNLDEDKVFVCDHSNNRIQVFQPNGQFLMLITDLPDSAKPQLRYPRGIYYTHDHRLLVSCTHAHCILELKEDGTYLSTIKDIIQPGGIVLRHNNKIVVTSNVNQVLLVLTL